MSSSGEKRKSGDDDSLTLEVKGQGMKQLLVTMKADCPMRKLMSAYCERWQQDLDTVKFLYGDDCRQILKRDTPRKLGLSHGDEILAVTHQHGGGFH